MEFLNKQSMETKVFVVIVAATVIVNLAYDYFSQLVDIA